MSSFWQNIRSIPQKLLKHVNVFDKVNKMPYGCLLNMAPHNIYSIKINVRTMTLADIIYVKMGKTPLNIGTKNLGT